MNRYKKLTASLAGLILTIFAASAWASVINATVSGKQNVYFAGHTLAELEAIRVADGTYAVADFWGDLSDPNTLPNAIDITGLGDLISISGSGLWSHATVGGDTGPEGRTGVSLLSSIQYEIFGVSLMEADLNMLVGVFLSNSAPTPGGAPPRLSAVAGDPMTSPLLNQSFAIGASLQNIAVPAGATRLYLGMHDGWEWMNNRGSVDVEISSVPEPTILALLGLGLAGFGIAKRRKLN